MSIPLLAFDTAYTNDPSREIISLPFRKKLKDSYDVFLSFCYIFPQSHHSILLQTLYLTALHWGSMQGPQGMLMMEQAKSWFLPSQAVLQQRETSLWLSKLIKTSIGPFCIFFPFTFQQFRAIFLIKHKGLSSLQKINHFWHLLVIHFCLKHIW